MKETMKRVFQIGLVVFILALSIGILLMRERFTQVGELGYAGLLLLCFLANSTVLLPAPSMLMAASCALIMNPLWVAVCASLGSALGEFTGYLLGHTGRDISPKFQRLLEWMRGRIRHPLLLIFLLALLPLPLFDVAGVYSGGTRVHPAKFFLACLPGKFLKTLVYTRMYDILAFMAALYGF